MSFQRRVGHGFDANRGAIPLHVLNESSDEASVLAPLAAGEDVWIALQLSGSAGAQGSARDGRRLHIVTRDLPSLRLLVVDGVEDTTGVSPLNSLGAATTAAEISWQLNFVIECVNSSYRLRTQFVTEPLYGKLSGLPMPPTSSPADGFTGKRLP